MAGIYPLNLNFILLIDLLLLLLKIKDFMSFIFKFILVFNIFKVNGIYYL